jgi:hypothetical protein
MASRVLCKKHGLQPTTLCCRHVLDAIEASGPGIELGTFRVDILGDATEWLDLLLCTACSDRYGLSAAAPIPAEVFEDEARFPWVGLACEECGSEWSRPPT